ncbi:MAG TPA: DUF2480 family protein [Haliscomenobacter sp.]|uniref:DUF2480 family protein n=1 Tax=Haliscomenobacter sp. TaxID=2717303 RepID=UPI002CBE01A0|nr:DUF2480 family protein [Haliscomenobacter sp.]HOY19652.1 DUF2480 family protein [Haliscomenobacter sp.]HPH19148.1 DUF2480 family protein [Haliscomenobacter sp.]
MEEMLVNRVANSGLTTINLEDFFPTGEIAHFDLVDYLFMGLILKEKDFREALKNHDWTQYQGKVLLVYCSNDSIIPVWAYMLVATYAEPFAKDIFQGDLENYYKAAYNRALSHIDPASYAGQRIVIKGCSDKPVPPAAYLELTRVLKPHVLSIMYGEPCSTVPIYKRKS